MNTAMSKVRAKDEKRLPRPLAALLAVLSWIGRSSYMIASLSLDNQLVVVRL